MNYETRLRHFVEEYATALFGNKDIICSIDVDTTEETVILFATEGSKVTVLMKYEYGKNHGIDEMEDESPKHFFESSPITFIRSEGGTYKSILSLFGRYCNVFSVNYILADIAYIVKDESAPLKEMAVHHSGLSNEYRKISMNASNLEMCAEIYLKDGSLFTQMVIESIEE